MPRLDKNHPVSILKQTKNLNNNQMQRSAEEIHMRRMGESVDEESYEQHSKRKSITARNEI